MSPNQQFIVTGGSEGGLFIWDTPPEVLKAKADSEMPVRPPTEPAQSQKGSQASKASKK